jgi:hypothetical protein
LDDLFTQLEQAVNERNRLWDDLETSTDNDCNTSFLAASHSDILVDNFSSPPSTSLLPFIVALLLQTFTAIPDEIETSIAHNEKLCKQLANKKKGGNEKMFKGLAALGTFV